jgi:hypothetical protein
VNSKYLLELHRFKIVISVQYACMKILLQTFIFIAILSVTVASVAYAFVNELKTNSATQRITNTPYFYVDSNTSDVDSNVDKGTHSNFTAQRSSPDYIDDKLTEVNNGISSNSTLLDDGFENFSWDTNWNAIPHNWREDNYPVHSGSASAHASNYNEGYFTSDSLDASDADAIYVDLWFRKTGTDYLDFTLYYHDGSNYDLIEELDDNGADNTWLHYTAKITDSQYFVTNFQIRFDATLDYGEECWVDDVLIIKESQSTNYELDLEEQWINVDFTETNEELCIYLSSETQGSQGSLDASGGYMIVGDGSVDWGSTAGTISFWVKMDSTVQGRFWGQDGNMETRWSGSNLVLDWGGTGSMTSATTFSADIWYFVAIVWDENANNLLLYVGDENNPPTSDANSLNGNWWSTTPSPTQNRFLNGAGGDEPLDGHGDDLRYYNIARSSSEIQSDYNVTITGSEMNLRSYFKLDNNFDDIGPNDNDGSGFGSYSFSSDKPFETVTENLKVDVWTGSAWQNVFTQLINGWNNATITPYLTSSTLTIRYKGSNETNDSTQDSWNVDTAVIHTWT